MDEFSYIQNQINQNNSWSAEQAQKQMEFQERMSNTAHQREVSDLKAAGLNPILSAKLGGASTPSGAMADVDQTGTTALANIIGKMLEINADNAKANLINAVSGVKSSGYSESSARSIKSSDINSVLGLFGVGVPNSAAKVADKLYDYGAKIADFFNLSDDSYARKYLIGDTNLIENVKKVGETVKNVTSNAVASIGKAVNSLGNTVKTALFGSSKVTPSKKSLTSSTSKVKK